MKKKINEQTQKEKRETKDDGRLDERKDKVNDVRKHMIKRRDRETDK